MEVRFGRKNGGLEGEGAPHDQGKDMMIQDQTRGMSLKTQESGEQCPWEGCLVRKEKPRQKLSLLIQDGPQ